MSFTHLHFHTDYSFLDGFNPVKKAVARLKELGMDSCAITDHNHMGGVIAFKKECEANGIKPILGVELYWTHDMKEIMKPIEERKEDATKRAEAAGITVPKKTKSVTQKAINEIIEPYMYDNYSYHIILLAKNEVGYHNLIKIQSEAAKYGKFNGRHHCDNDLLMKYHEGIICLTACMSGYSAKMIRQDKYDEADKYLQFMTETFGDDFYLEVQPFNDPNQNKINRYYYTYSKNNNIKIAATNDVHWTLADDWDDHDTLICVGLGMEKHDENRTQMRYPWGLHIRSEEEMKRAFEEQADTMYEQERNKQGYLEAMYKACDTTQEIADKIEVYGLAPDHDLFPVVDIGNMTPEEALEKKAFTGLYEYLKKHPDYNQKEYEDRLRFELNVINKKGYAPYFICVEEYVTWANNNGCPTGPGRGSASGSLALFCTGVTKNIDPIQNQLLFGRFLTEDRKSPPDVDTDFSDVIPPLKHLEEYYGEENVSAIGTYSTMAMKVAIKDIMRALGYPAAEGNKVTKSLQAILPKEISLSFKKFEALKDDAPNDYEKFKTIENKYEEVFRLARRFEGLLRGTGVHASGVLVTPTPITDWVPVHTAKRDDKDIVITYYDGPQLEELRHIKFDILGLNNINIIVKTLNYINPDLTIEDLYDIVDIGDKDLYKELYRGNSDTVFQLSSDLMKGLIDKIKPTEFNDIVAITSLGRPGPLDAGFDKDYAEGKNDNKIHYCISGCEDILGQTYGVVVYQEQLMAISKRIAGFNDSQADSITRKITAKKRREMFPMMIRCHIYGKKNCEGPEGWEKDDKAPWYDPKGKYGPEISGALVNGYTEEEVLKYFETIEGFASYAFNKSHAAAYSYISVLTMFLKKNYPVEYLAACLSSCEGKKEKIAKYIPVLKKLGITLRTPDINVSGKDFTPLPDTNEILYGLQAVAKVSDASLEKILELRPFNSLQDMLKRIPKKNFNKAVGSNLIKSGALKEFNENRNALLNEFYSLRGDTDWEPLDDSEITIEQILTYEEETLDNHVTYKTWWEELEDGEQITIPVTLMDRKEHTQKNGKLMLFATLYHDNCEFEALIFATQYLKLIAMSCQQQPQVGLQFEVTGSKDGEKFKVKNINKILQ